MAGFIYDIPANEVFAGLQEIIKARLSSEGLMVEGEIKLAPDIGRDGEFYGFRAILEVVGSVKVFEKGGENGDQGSK